MKTLTATALMATETAGTVTLVLDYDGGELEDDGVTDESPLPAIGASHVIAAAHVGVENWPDWCAWFQAQAELLAKAMAWVDANPDGTGQELCQVLAIDDYALAEQPAQDTGGK